MDTLQIVITLEIYGVKNIVGIPFGYRGFSDKDLTEMPVLFDCALSRKRNPNLCFCFGLWFAFLCFQLSRKVVQNIHLSGGSLLGVSRGGPSVSEIVDSMEVSFSFFQSLRNFMRSQILNSEN